MYAKLENQENGRYEYDVDHYTIALKTGGIGLTEFIYENRERMSDVEIMKGTMDDVFLNLTGKELVS